MFVVGLVVTGVLVWISASTYTNNENRLLRLRVRDAGALIAEALPSVQTPLASAAALGGCHGRRRGQVRELHRPQVGPQGRRQFVSVSLWRLGNGRPGLLAVVGVPPALAASPTRATSFFARAARNRQLSVIGLLQSSQPRLGWSPSWRRTASATPTAGST